MASPRTVHILLATYQGAQHLQGQLDSIAAQTHADWRLLVSDDGSTDGTQDIVQRFASKQPQQVSLLQGPGRGATANFFHLIDSVRYAGPSELFAFCDQDDVWLPGKLAAAVAWHGRSADPARPHLYCGRTRITDDALRPVGASRVPRKPLTLGNALVENIAGGNTMVFDTMLLEILRHIRPEHSVLHDWSAYLVATACGGVVHYDPEPHVLYRQHASNVVGVNPGPVVRARRVIANWRGQYRRRSDLTERAMDDIAPFLADPARSVFDQYRKARHAASAVARLRHAAKAGIFRQSPRDQVALMLAFAAGLA